MRGHDATERPVASVEEKTHARRHSLRITSPAQSPTQAPTAPKWWAWRSRPVPETNVPGDAAFAGRGTPRIALCTPITSGDGEGTWEVRRRPRARAAGERCGGGGEKGRSAGIKRQICKTGKLGKSCYPTNLRVTNPSLFRQSVGRNASMPVVPAPVPSHQRHIRIAYSIYE